MQHLYGVLGVDRDVDDARLKAAYRASAKRCHPDLNAGDRGAERRFVAINLAYQTLSNPTRRAAYDAHWAALVRNVRRRRWNAAVMLFASFTITVSSCLLTAKWLLLI
jgi:curved DNA-binding protein CbpA